MGNTEERSGSSSARIPGEAFYRTLIENSLEVISLLDADGTILFDSASIADTLGYLPGERIGTNAFEYLHPEDLERLQDAMVVLLRTGGRAIYSYRQRTRKGDWIWTESLGVNLLHDENVHAILVSTRDITQTVQAEQALREREALTRAALNALPDLVFRLSRNGDYIEFHAPDPSLLATPPENLVHGNIRDVLPADIYEAYLDAIGRALATKEVQTLDYRLRVIRGEERDFEARLAFSSKNEVVAIVRDVTQRKQYEAELVEARRRAEEAVRLKTAFLANMSHEIRTPLTSIIGFSEIVADQLEGEKAEFVRLIHAGGLRLLETLNSVLDLTQLESGIVTLHPLPVDLHMVIEQSIELFRQKAEDKGIRLDFKPAATPIVTVADQGALGRVLNNLISNAVKFTSSGSVTVEAEVAGDEITIRVSDTGKGIDPAFLPHVFDEFRQESNGITRSHEGSGLGLAIARHLVALMNGHIEAANRPEGGSVFTIRLPYVTPT